jgi:hypothetical protein
MYRHANGAEGGGYRIGAGVEGEKAIVDHNVTLRVGSAVVNR